MAERIVQASPWLARGFRRRYGLRRWQGLVLAALRAMATRRALAALDNDRLLRDIGLSRAEALAEARRAPWDLAPPRETRTGRNGPHSAGTGATRCLLRGPQSHVR